MSETLECSINQHGVYHPRMGELCLDALRRLFHLPPVDKIKQIWVTWSEEPTEGAIPIRFRKGIFAWHWTQGETCQPRGNLHVDFEYYLEFRWAEERMEMKLYLSIEYTTKD